MVMARDGAEGISSDPTKCHMPVLLSCGHSFCQSCLIKLAREQNKSVQCPTCEKKMKLEQGESYQELFRPDVQLIGLLALQKFGISFDKDLLRQFDKKEIVNSKTKAPDCSDKDFCVECSIQDAACHCSKCDVKLCKSCFEKVHSSSKILKTHEAVPLASTIKVPAVETHCKTHERLIEYFCEEDQTPICSHCVIVGTHRDHVITAMEEKNAESLNELKEILPQTERVLVLLNRSKTVVNDIFADMRSATVQLINHVRMHFTDLHSSIQAREQVLLKEMVELIRSERLPLEELKMKLQEDIITLENVMRESKKMVEHSEEGVVNAQGLVQSLKSFQDIPCYLEHDQVTLINSLRQALVLPEDLAEQINSYGEMKLNSPAKKTMIRASNVSEDLLCEIRSQQQEVSAPVTEDDTGSESFQSDDSSITATTVKPQKIRICPNKQEKVYVTHIKNPVHFVVQRCGDVHRLNALGRDINNFCRSAAAEKTKLTSVNKGDSVLCHFEYDNNWYRARVMEVENDFSGNLEIEVFYIDYGNMETVNLDRLRAIKKKFSSVPELSSVCSLQDIAPVERDKWSDESIQLFARFTQDKPMNMTILDEREGVLCVDLSKPANENILDDRPVSVRDALVFLELAIVPTQSHPRKDPPTRQLSSRSYIKPALQELRGSKLHGIVSHGDSPHSFYIQRIGGEMNYLTEMMTQIQKVYENDKSDLYTVFVPQKGEVCVAKFKQDLAWYRAQVVDLPGNRMVQVRFVDYGNTDEVHYLQLKKILNEFLVLPMQALHCTLADVEPLEENWSESAIEFLNSLLQNTLDVTVVDLAGPHLSVVLHDCSGAQPVCLNSLLVQQGLARSTGPRSKVEDRAICSLEVEKSPDLKKVMSRESVDISKTESLKAPPLTQVLVSHVVNPGHFYIQLYSAAEDGLNVLMEELQENCMSQQPTSKEWVKGEFCAVRYTADGKWYRAKIEEISDETQKVQIHLLDYGFKDIQSKDELYDLSEDHCKVNCFSVRCHIQNIKPAGDSTKWSQTAVELFRDKIQNHTLFIAYFVQDQCESLPVELLQEEHIKGDALTGHQIQYISVSEWLKDKGVALPDSRMKLSPVGGELQEKVSVSCKRTVKREQLSSSFPPHPVSSDTTIQAIPTYVDYDCTIYVQPFYPDNSFQGRFGYILKENTLEVMLQDDYLKSRNLHRAKIPRDGNCMFRCFAQGIFHDQNRHLELRESVVACLKSQWELFQNIIGNTEKEVYLEDMSQDGSYGGEPEVQAICHIYNIGTCIYLGGLKSKIQERRYGRLETTVKLCYICDGSYDQGHYDLVVETNEQRLDIEQTYSKWREDRLIELSSNPTNYDTTYYDESVLGQLMEFLQEEYKNSTPSTPVDEWNVGQQAIAYCPDYDSLFYRGIIREIFEKTVKVFFVDFGDTREVKKENLRSDIALASIPQQCFPIRARNLIPASGPNWKVNELTQIHNFIVNKTCTLFIQESEHIPGNPLTVDIEMPDGTNLVAHLQNEGLAAKTTTEEILSKSESILEENVHLPVSSSSTVNESEDTTVPVDALSSDTVCSTPDMNLISGASSPDQSARIPSEFTNQTDVQSPTAPIRSNKSPYGAMEIGEVNESVQVKVTHVDSPNQVYVQCLKTESGSVASGKLPQISVEKLTELMDVNKTINSELSNYPRLKKISVGEACCAKFSCDETWYRAEIIQCDAETVGVRFVDYGNFDYLPPDELRQIPDDLRSLPAMARCCLLDQVPSDGVWKDEEKQLMENLLLYQNFIAVIKDSKDDVAVLALYSQQDFEIGGEGASLFYQSVLDQYRLTDKREQAGCSDLIGDDVEESNEDSVT